MVMVIVVIYQEQSGFKRLVNRGKQKRAKVRKPAALPLNNIFRLLTSGGANKEDQEKARLLARRPG